MREVSDPEELNRLAGGNLLCEWTAQGFLERPAGVARAWATDDDRAVAVACPGLATKDRIALCGSLAAVTGLIGLVLEEVGPSFRPIGEPGLIRKLCEMVELPEGNSLEAKAPFGWMDRRAPLDHAAADAQWLGADRVGEIDDLLDRAHATSDARPSDPEIERWAGILDDHGRLIASAGLGWSAPTVGYLVGVAVDPRHQGRGLGARVCRLVAATAIAESGAVGLMVDQDNPAARRLYDKLGFAYHPVLASVVPNGL